jgi:hypothetical protein
MFSYQYAGFSGAGLGGFFAATTFPVRIGDLRAPATLQLLFDTLFTLLTASILVAIITGAPRPAAAQRRSPAPQPSPAAAQRSGLRQAALAAGPQPRVKDGAADRNGQA